jgi:hypothetical protein
MIGQQWNERDPNEPHRPGFTYADATIRTYGSLHDSFVDEMKVYGADPAQHPNMPMRVVAKSSGMPWSYFLAARASTIDYLQI